MVALGWVEPSEATAALAAAGIDERTWLNDNSRAYVKWRSTSSTECPAQVLLDRSRVLVWVTEVSDLGQAVLKRGIAPFEVGLEERGWYRVTEALVCPMPAALGQLQMTWPWVLLTVEEDAAMLLPQYVKFSEYDVGHAVVVIRGGVMGQRGTISDVRHGAYMLGSTASHKHDYVGALLTADRRELVPLRVRLPPESPAWVFGGGHWEPGIISDYMPDGHVVVWMTALREIWRVRRSRTTIRPRLEGQPPPSTAHPGDRRRGAAPPSQKDGLF